MTHIIAYFISLIDEIVAKHFSGGNILTICISLLYQVHNHNNDKVHYLAIILRLGLVAVYEVRSRFYRIPPLMSGLYQNVTAQNEYNSVM